MSACVVAGQGVVPKPPNQTEEGHHQGFRQTLVHHIRVFGHLQHPPPPGAGPPPVGPRPAAQLPAGASSSSRERLPAEQPGWRLLRFTRDQQQHSSQLPIRRDVRSVAAFAGGHPAVASAGCPAASLPLLLHAAARGRSPRTDVHLRVRLFSF